MLASLAFLAALAVFSLLFLGWIGQTLAQGDSVESRRHELLQARLTAAARQQRRPRPVLSGRRLTEAQILDRARFVIGRARLTA
jgi:hypothetical protein